MARNVFEVAVRDFVRDWTVIVFVDREQFFQKENEYRKKQSRSSDTRLDVLPERLSRTETLVSEQEFVVSNNELRLVIGKKDHFVRHYMVDKRV